MNLLEALKALFSPTRRLTDAGRTAVQVGGALGPREWVVSRSACHFRRIEAPGAAGRKRHAMAGFAVRRAYPSASARHHVRWQGSAAHVWIWDRPTVPDDEHWIPESALLPRPAADGARLIALTQGVEAQYWRNGELAASRWWPRTPTLDAWRGFLRAAGQPIAESPDAVPEPQRLRWLANPWGQGVQRLPWTPATMERTGWVAVAALLALLSGWQLLAWGHWSLSSARLQGRIEQLRAEASPLLVAREQAEAEFDLIQDYRQLQSWLSDYVLMAEVMQALPEGSRFESWRREANRIQARLQSPASDPRVFVQAFGSHPGLRRVVAAPQPQAGVVQLDFELPPGWPKPGEEAQQ